MEIDRALRGIKTGGRQKGTKNRKTVLLEEKGRKTLAEVIWWWEGHGQWWEGQTLRHF
jgi:DNA-binding PadR family transcriptional regulator